MRFLDMRVLPARFLLAVLFSLCMLIIPKAYAAELVMFEQQGCVYCQKWEREIGQAYPKTSEGKAAPLRKVDINRPIPEDLAGIRVERFTPTFVLLEQGEEVGRIRGYPGDEFFWFLLNELLEKAKQTAG